MDIAVQRCSDEVKQRQNKLFAVYPAFICALFFIYVKVI